MQQFTNAIIIHNDISAQPSRRRAAKKLLAAGHYRKDGGDGDHRAGAEDFYRKIHLFIPSDIHI
jgi:hypothetical protein